MSGNSLLARENQEKRKQYDDLLIGVHLGGGWTQINLNRVDDPEELSRKETQYELEGLRSTVSYFLGYMPLQDFMVTIGAEIDRYYVKNQEKYTEDETKTSWFTLGMRYYFLCKNCYTSISTRTRVYSNTLGTVVGRHGNGYTLSFEKELRFLDDCSLGIGLFYNHTRRIYKKFSTYNPAFGSRTIYETHTRENYYGVQLTLAYDL